MRRLGVIAGLALSSVGGCEGYEFPPRVLGVATEDCPDCEVLALSETRLPLGSATVTGRFAFDDDQGSISNLRIFVTAPSGAVVEEPYFDADDRPQTRPGFTCTFAIESADDVGTATCVVTAERFRATNSTDVAVRLEGYEQGLVTATFGVNFSEFGEWTVEVEAERSDGVRSNRLATTIDIVDDVGDGDDDDVDTDTN